MGLKDKMQIGAGVLKAHLFGKKVPIAVYLSVTDRCNLQCRYCNIPDKRRGNDLTTQQIYSLIDQIAEMGTKRLQLTGGEPMLRKDIGRIIDYASSKGIYVTMSSNGFQVAERIDELGNLGTLFLSLDGMEESHDYHKGKGTFKRTIKAIDAAKNDGINVWVTTVISRKNNDISKFLKFVKKKGVLVNIHLLYRVKEQLDKHFHLFNMPKELIMSDAEIKETLLRIIEEKKKDAPIASSFGYLYHLLGWKDYGSIYSLEKTRGIKCWAGKLHCYIDTDGSVYPCGDCVGRVKALNFLKGGFENAFKACKNPCESCIIACDVEQNLMFSLNLKTIWNWLNKIK